MPSLKPKRLKTGDTVAVLSPSWGGPGLFPHIYENGLKVLRAWGLKVKEYPTARADAGYLRGHPEVRAKDINDAFADRKVKAVFASIGGDDSVRILPFLQKKAIRGNPKILMGYSDTTTLHVYAQLQGVATFYGPSLMAGFSQMGSLPQSFQAHVHDLLFEPRSKYEYKPYSRYCEGYPNWGDVRNTGKVHPLRRNKGWNWLQGRGTARGELFGGCVEVLEMMKGTEFWPSRDFWRGKILFLETSEEKPTLPFMDHVLRNYGMQGVFNGIAGLILGRARSFSDGEKDELERILVSIVSKEFGRGDLPIVSNFDVGHTDPQLVLPLGVKAELDCGKRKISLVEPWLT